MEIKEDQSDFRKFWRIILFETSDFSELEKLHLTTYLESQKNQNKLNQLPSSLTSDQSLKKNSRDHHTDNFMWNISFANEVTQLDPT